MGLYSSSSEPDGFLFLPLPLPGPLAAAGGFFAAVSESESQTEVSGFFGLAGAFRGLGAASDGFLAEGDKNQNLNV